MRQSEKLKMKESMASNGDSSLRTTMSEIALPLRDLANLHQDEHHPSRAYTTSFVHRPHGACSLDGGLFVSNAIAEDRRRLCFDTMAGANVEGQDITQQRNVPYVRRRPWRDIEEAGTETRSFKSEAGWLFGHKYTAMSHLRAALFSSWTIASLILAVPVGFAVKYTNQSPVITFVVNFIAIIPLSKILDVVTDELAIRWGGHRGLFVIVTFSNGVQLVITIIALLKEQIDIVQTSLVGSVISNMVLMVGIGFFLGGLNRNHQEFDPSPTSSSLYLLMLIVAALIIPTAFQVSAQLDHSFMAKFSRAESVLLLICYLCYLLYAYKSHYSLYTRPNIKVSKLKFVPMDGDVARHLALCAASLAATTGGVATQDNLVREPGRVGHMSLWTLSLTLVFDTIILGFCATFTVDSIDGLTQRTALSQSFIGLILLPLLSCNIHAIKLAREDDMPRSFSITIGSSIQVMLFILPLAVIIGWIRDDPNMTLLLDGFQVASLAIAVLVLKYITDDGLSNWLDGFTLMALYAMIALGAWFVPDKVLRPA